MNATAVHVKAMRTANRKLIVEAMAEGRIQRAVFHKPAKGRGSYNRKSKHGKGYES